MKGGTSGYLQLQTKEGCYARPHTGLCTKDGVPAARAREDSLHVATGVSWISRVPCGLAVLNNFLDLEKQWVFLLSGTWPQGIRVIHKWSGAEQEKCLRVWTQLLKKRTDQPRTRAPKLGQDSIFKVIWHRGKVQLNIVGKVGQDRP